MSGTRLTILGVIALMTSSLATANPMTLNLDPAGTVQSDGHQVQYSDGAGVATFDNFFDDSIDFFNSQYIASNVVCFDARFGVCNASGAIYFSDAIFDLKFTMEQTSTLNLNANASIYNGGNLIASLRWGDIPVDPLSPSTPGPTRRFDFSGFGPVTELRLIPGDTAFYGDFEFNGAPVPTPPLTILFMAALGGIWFKRHRDKLLNR